MLLRLVLALILSKLRLHEELAKFIELIDSCEIETVYIPAIVDYKSYTSLLKIKSIIEILPSNTDDELPKTRSLRKMPACSKDLKQLFIPQCINQITEKSFYGCAELTYLYLSPSVVAFDYHAFSNCTKLKKVVCHKNQKSLIPVNELPKGVKIETYGTEDVPHTMKQLELMQNYLRE